MKRFLDKALECYDLVVGDVLVYVCLYGMIEDHKIYLEILSFSSFSRLLEAMRCMNVSARDLKVEFIDPIQDETQAILNFSTLLMRGEGGFISPLIVVEDRVIRLPKEFLPSITGQKDPK